MTMSEEVLGRTLEGLGRSFEDLSGELTDAFNTIVKFRHSMFVSQQARENVQIAEEVGSESEARLQEINTELDQLDSLRDMLQIRLIPQYQLVCAFLELDPDALNADIDRVCYQIELEKSGIRLG